MIRMNIDGGGEDHPGWNSINPFRRDLGTETADKIVIQRYFERIDHPQNFLKQLRNVCTDRSEIYLFSMVHDGITEFVKGFSDLKATEVAFGKDHEKDGRWLRKYADAQEIINMFEDEGFLFEGYFTKLEDFAPPYPHWCLKFRKAENTPSWRYVLGTSEFDQGLNVIDIGPGNSPWPRANVYMDHLQRQEDKAYREQSEFLNKRFIWADIQNYNHQIKDREFDFAWAAHIFEHLEDPAAGARELSRIAKRGVVVVPSVYKDAILFWEETDHKWDILPPKPGTNRLRFIRRNKDWINNVRDTHMQSIMCHLLKGNDRNSVDQKYAKNWFAKKEKNLDLVIHWEGQFEIDIL